MAERMDERLRRLYGDGEITEKGLESAVQRKWITEEQMRKIITEETEA